MRCQKWFVGVSTDAYKDILFHTEGECAGLDGRRRGARADSPVELAPSARGTVV